MSVLIALVLGLVQGLTEFLPVSSSGHLVIFQHLFGVGGEENVLFDVTVHVGTLVAVFLVYASDLRRVVGATLVSLGLALRGHWREAWASSDARLGAWIVVGTLPAVVAGLLLKDLFEQLFGSLLAVGAALVVTGGVLWLSGWLSDRRREAPKGESDLHWWDALLIGTAQAAAITPGISRSGSTIAAGLALGLDRELTARYSFLLSIPAILGALVLHLDEALGAGQAALGPLAAGFLAAAVSGYVALRVLIRLVARGRFALFAWYVVPLGLAVIAWALTGA